MHRRLVAASLGALLLAACGSDGPRTYSCSASVSTGGSLVGTVSGCAEVGGPLTDADRDALRNRCALGTFAAAPCATDDRVWSCALSPSARAALAGAPRATDGRLVFYAPTPWFVGQQLCELANGTGPRATVSCQTAPLCLQVDGVPALLADQAAGACGSALPGATGAVAPCPAAGRVGTCTLAAGAPFGLSETWAYYPPAPAALDRAACAALKGAWNDG